VEYGAAAGTWGDQGYYHGQVDGVIGSGTIDAVRKFQADHGLTTTGKIDPQLLNALGIDYKAHWIFSLTFGGFRTAIYERKADAFAEVRHRCLFSLKLDPECPK
jgi:peptidoglycan hydrolase-like protein with peptidoglycan-binding domain